MLRMVALALRWLASLVKPRRRLQAKNLILRHQLNILRRQASERDWMSDADRLAFVWLYRLCPTVVDVVRIVRPGTRSAGTGAGSRLFGAGSHGPAAVGRLSPGRFGI
jgi:hypothetical protein